jgi:hypothetical protein
MSRRTGLLIAGVLIVWGSLAYRFIVEADPRDRLLAIVFGLGVTALAALILRRPVLPRKRGEGLGGMETGSGNLGSHDSND